MSVKEVQDGLRKTVGEEGSIGLFIKSKNTEFNAQIHNAFREFCKVECDDDYTQGLKTLLNAYQADFKYELLAEQITSLQAQIDELRQHIEQPKEQERGAF